MELCARNQAEKQPGAESTAVRPSRPPHRKRYTENEIKVKVASIHQRRKQRPLPRGGLSMRYIQSPAPPPASATGNDDQTAACARKRRQRRAATPKCVRFIQQNRPSGKAVAATCDADVEVPPSPPLPLATHCFGVEAGTWARPGHRKYGERVPLGGADGRTVNLDVRADLELVPSAATAKAKATATATAKATATRQRQRQR